MAHPLASAIAGFSEQYVSDHDPTIKQRKCERTIVAQPKAKRVQRSTIELDMGASTPEFAFNPADIVPPIRQFRRLLDHKFSDLASGPPLTFINKKDN
jgi:hypothetical protein